MADMELRSFSRDHEESAKQWESLQMLPTHDRMRKAILTDVPSNDSDVPISRVVDVEKLDGMSRKLLMDRILKTVDEGSENFLGRIRERFDRVGLELPKIEVRFENLEVEGKTYVGSRALPTLSNVTINALDGLLGSVCLSSSKKKVKKILMGISGILKPSRMTLLLGPPGSGKTTLLKALAGKLDKNLHVSGKVAYNGHELSEFVPERTSTYISQHDIHTGEMTVRETIDFSGRCLGVGTRYKLLYELLRREKDAGIRPDLDIDAYMKAVAMEGQKTNVATDYILKVLGLDFCADIIAGDEMRRGISGGQKKRLTTGEMLAGPAKVLIMDEISTGLDSSTTFQIVKFIRQMAHVMDSTVIMSLLQPAVETFDLFDDVILFADGQIVYNGPRENVLEFFEFVGFKCPERKAIPDFLQQVISRKDQKQYWSKKSQPYRYVSVSELVQSFKSFHVGEYLWHNLRYPFDKSSAHYTEHALSRGYYGISNWELFKACLSREWLLMKRNSFLYIFKIAQITIMSVMGMTVFLKTEMHHKMIADGGKFFGALFYSLVNMMFNSMAELAMTVYRLPVFYKQRDLLFYPSWAFSLPYVLLKIPLSLMDSGIWVILTYYMMGFAPSASRCFRQFVAFFCVHHMSMAIFRFIAAVGRTMVLANTFATFALLVVFVLGGFVISRDDIQPWWIWGYWISPMMYGQNAIAINEFLDPRWNNPNNDATINEPTIGKAILRSKGMFVEGYWYWISVGALIGFSFLYNILFVLALTYLKPLGSIQTTMTQEDSEKPVPEHPGGANNEVSVAYVHGYADSPNHQARRGMVLPFEPLSLAFDHVNYYVDMPAEMKRQGIEDSRLQLLRDVSGAFRAGILTALVGVSGAGKTTLMDVLAGRKTGGYVEGSVYISGYPKKQETFARISGYCEQNDIHSPYVTVFESLAYSAWLRLAPEVNRETRKMFVEEIMELVELDVIRDSLVGLPGVDGLSTEQRKRLTIAVELVSNPSIIFMDEPTTGLDARAAAIVMRTVRNTVDTGRTVVCTIHQPSIDIFESFDELLLLKMGGQVIYEGDLGDRSHKLVQYFEAIPGIPKITEGYNPATWMLEISSPSVESRLNIDFAEIYSNSSLYEKNEAVIQRLSCPSPGSKDISFDAKYAQTFTSQCAACFWKHFWSYWRNPQYNATRFILTLVAGLMFGTIFWNKGQHTDTEQDLSNLIGAIYVAIFFVGLFNSNAVQPIVAIERTVLYRERAAGMYSSMSYAFAQMGVEVVYLTVQSLLYSVILFSMIGFSWQAGDFFWFIYFIFMSFVCLTLYGMMVMALTPSHQIASVVSALIISFWNLFGGFIIPRPMIPIWWRWFYWANPVAWTVYGLTASQLGDKNNLVQIPGLPIRLDMKFFLKEMLGFEYSFVCYAAVAHVGFIILFAFTFAFCIRYLNFQHR